MVGGRAGIGLVTCRWSRGLELAVRHSIGKELAAFVGSGVAAVEQPRELVEGRSIGGEGASSCGIAVRCLVVAGAALPGLLIHLPELGGGGTAPGQLRSAAAQLLGLRA